MSDSVLRCELYTDHDLVREFCVWLIEQIVLVSSKVVPSPFIPCEESEDKDTGVISFT